MSDAPTPQFEQQLAELTAWHGPVPRLWRRALSSSSKSRRLVSRWVVGMLAVAALVMLAVMVTLPSLQTARHRARIAAFPTESTTAPERGRTVLGLESLRYSTAQPETMVGPAAGEGSVGGGTATQSPTNQGAAGIERQVVRKATIELRAKDVRAVFLKACQLLSEAQGEYVQDSSLTGEGVRTEANLTLRVAAERLPEVLNELRQLGEVRSEKITGEDVTGQVVDLEARLRNEQRVEAELLSLLEARKNSPLKEILELRSSIGNVRQTIEQLTAQRERLGRLVSLASVLVIIRFANAPAPVEAELWTHFTSALRDSVNRGLRFLSHNVADVIGIAIGGLIWWALLIVAILVVRTYWRRRRAAG